MHLRNIACSDGAGRSRSLGFYIERLIEGIPAEW